MNRSDVEQRVYLQLAEKFDPPLTRGDVKIILGCFENVISQGLADPNTLNGKVCLRGFGTFQRRIRKARTYTVRGEAHQVGDRITVTFKPGAYLLEKIT